MGLTQEKKRNPKVTEIAWKRTEKVLNLVFKD